ncbi:MAG: type IV pilus modification PilV family protein [Opitutaceae bacterium]
MSASSTTPHAHTRCSRPRWSGLTPSRFPPAQPGTSPRLPDCRSHQRLGVNPLHLEPPLSARAFSLLEVVAAVAIFSIGMVAALGLFTPVAKSVSNVADSEAAARVADAVRARLQALPFDRAVTLIQEVADVRKNDGDGAYNPNDGTKHPAVLFGKRTGDVGVYDPSEGKNGWYDSNVPTPRRLADAEKFFEIDLIRNDTLTPKAGDATAVMVAYTMRVRWPAFVMTSPAAAVQTGQNPAGGPVPFDHGRKQILFFTGSIMR